MESLPPDREHEERPEAVPRWYGPYRPFLGSPPPRPWHPPAQVAICVALFLATALSTALTNGPAYAVAVMVILLSHEMGHYFMCRRYRVRSTLPFFIPFFPLRLPFARCRSWRSPFGTLGARHPHAPADRQPQGGLRHRHRRTAGGSGAVRSPRSPTVWRTRAWCRRPPPGTGPVNLGDSLVLLGLEALIHPHLPAGMELMLHPVGLCRLGRALPHLAQPASRGTARRRPRPLRAARPPLPARHLGGARRRDRPRHLPPRVVRPGGAAAAVRAARPSARLRRGDPARPAAARPRHLRHGDLRRHLHPRAVLVLSSARRLG